MCFVCVCVSVSQDYVGCAGERHMKISVIRMFFTLSLLQLKNVLYPNFLKQ